MELLSVGELLRRRRILLAVGLVVAVGDLTAAANSPARENKM